jgi:MoaA/NifB/PqqE/SkfB family radical SAM enzyme
MTFDTLGAVRACCQHSRHHLLGRIPEQTLDEIWNGPAATALREAVREYNFDRGCGFCKWQVLDGNYQGAFARHYDWLADDGRWPRVMEFMVSNTCNLECVMCCGEWSHLIRSRREKAPPLPKLYDDRFFADLRRYLPHLRLAKFAGGEPFLSRESFRIWETMAELGLATQCFVTTNGTIYNAKVESILRQFPTDLAISMDGTTKETFESIRVNADFDSFVRNVRKFREYVAGRNGVMNLNFCLQRKNWREFGEFLLFADELDVQAFVCTVTQPRSESIYTLSAMELSEVVQTLESQSDSIHGRLGRNRGVWIEELARLRHRLEKHREQPAVYQQAESPNPASRDSAILEEIRLSPAMVERRADEARRELRRWSGQDRVQEVVADFDDRIRGVQIDPSVLAANASPPSVGDDAGSLMGLIVERFGNMVLESESKSSIGEERVFQLGDDSKAKLRALTIPEYGAAGESIGRRTLFAVRTVAAP